MLARLQQFVTLSLLAAAGGWLLVWWGNSRVLAVFGFLLIALGYSVLLAMEFVALHFLNQNDPVGVARWSELLRAWWDETRTLPQVFCWRQPFRSRAVSDFLPKNGRRGVVFVHGFICNRGLWTPWMDMLLSHEHAFVAVDLEPVFGQIEGYLSIIETAVQRVTEATGLPPVLVCHSMGGLAARAWLRHVASDARVYHVVTIATPHYGTWLGQFSPVPNGMQMRRASTWLQQLQSEEPPSRNALFTCWFSNCDNIVFPVSTATLPGADNRFVAGTAHVSLVFDPVVMAGTFAVICAEKH